MFTPGESVAQSLQGIKVTALGSVEASKLLCQRLNSLRQDDIFADLVDKTKQYAERYNLKPPHPASTSKTPTRFRHTAEEEEGELGNIEGK
ncbi:Hypothetical protein FKW44_018691 [Caligus rogercresseyi]|uniref:Uncharacterized protein n=1 Tax=Caligus rogercresseyi TaxID=217165 RepID=A0A7T8JY73_CALRO|nr:Hypothetical protein FKW44_018691 [Caligus rogercresseyi]